MYSPTQLRMVLAPTGGNGDGWNLTMANFLEACGWTKQMVGTAFTVTTTLDALSYKFFGGNPANDLFWLVTNVLTGVCWPVIDAASNSTGTFNPGCGNGAAMDISNPPNLLGGLLKSVITFDTSQAATHRGVLIAILLTYGVTTAQIQALFQANNAFENSTIKIEPISAVQSRVILKDQPLNVVVFNIGNAVHTGLTNAGVGGGYVSTSQPSRKTVLKGGIPTTYGGDNFVRLYFTLISYGLPGIHPAIFGAKTFAAYPPDTVRAVDGIYSPEIVHCSQAGLMDGILRTTVAFANQYQVIAHNENPGGGEGFMVAGGLKLVDTRDSQADDLWIQEATHVSISSSPSGVSPGGGGLHTFWNPPGVQRLVLNGTARYQGGSSGESGNPCLTPLVEARLSGNALFQNGVGWEEGCAPGWEPWYAFNPLQIPGGAVRGPILGQLWDAHGQYVTIADPLAAGPFAWDPPIDKPLIPKRMWRYYSKNIQTAPGGTGRPAGVLALKWDGDWP